MIKQTILLLLCSLLAGCVGHGMRAAPIVPSAVADRDWSKFERPPAGTPCAMRVFFWANRWRRAAVDVPGQWDDGRPFIVSFRIWKDIPNVVRIEIRHREQTIAAKNFDPPTTFERGKTVGYEK